MAVVAGELGGDHAAADQLLGALGREGYCVLTVQTIDELTGAAV